METMIPPKDEFLEIQQDKIQDGLGRWLKALLPPDGVWSVCPVCHLEWTKLRPCKFWNGQHTEEAFVCVLCAEYPHRIRRVMEAWPWLGIDVEITTKHYDAVVTCSSMSFLLQKISSNTDGGPVIKINSIQDSEKVTFKNNMIDVWFWLREQFANGESAIIENVWTKIRKGKKRAA